MLGDVPAPLSMLAWTTIGLLVGVFHRQQALDRVLLLLAGRGGVDLDHLVGILAPKEVVGLEELHQLAGVLGVAGDHQLGLIVDSNITFPVFNTYHVV